MGGALWWLLAAAVSGSWLMLLALVLSLAAWALLPAADPPVWRPASAGAGRAELAALGQVGAGSGPAGDGVHAGGQNRRAAER